MSEATELIELPPAETALEVFSKPSGLEPWLQRIREQVIGVAPDVSTRKGREEIASRAFKVRKSKTALDGLGKKLVDDLKDVPKKIDAERKRMRDALDALADEVRAPLNEWEAAEEARLQKHNAAVMRLSQFGANASAAVEADVLRAMLQDVESTVVDESWEEFEPEAHRAKAKSQEALREALAAREKHDAEQAELARLRAEAAAREQKEREERIAREAAERAQRDAEAEAQAERDAAIKREAEAKAAAERRELELKLAAEKSEREKLQAQQQAEQARIDAKAQAERAAAAERQRQANEAARITAERRRREADMAHKASINRAALQAFVDGGMPEDCAKLAVTLIAKGQIPAIAISY